MSVENHPNFHVINFTAQITSSYYKSLRGSANKENAPDVSAAIVEFATRIENLVDSEVWFHGEVGKNG